MPLLSLCMPTRRSLAQSRPAIEQAVAVCEARDAVLVLSDNSGDPDKEAYCRARSPVIRYVKSQAPDAIANFLCAVDAADTPFVLLIGDDDGIRIERALTPFDLASLPDDHVGVRPKTEVFTSAAGTYRVKDFSIETDTPSGRVREYSEKAAGDNSAFYSIFRREPYLDLLRLFSTHHPTGSGFSDWALSMAMFAYGKMVYDPSLVYRYNADQWASAAGIAAKNAELFEAAGLPEQTTLFQPLLMALDLFVFVSRPGTPLDREGALDAASIAAGDVLNGFVNQVLRRPRDYSERLRYLAGLVQAETDLLSRFQIGLIMADELKPGLKDGYVRFYRAANGLV